MHHGTRLWTRTLPPHLPGHSAMQTYVWHVKFVGKGYIGKASQEYNANLPEQELVSTLAYMLLNASPTAAGGIVQIPVCCASDLVGESSYLVNRTGKAVSSIVLSSLLPVFPQLLCSTKKGTKHSSQHRYALEMDVVESRLPCGGNEQAFRSRITDCQVHRHCGERRWNRDLPLAYLKTY